MGWFARGADQTQVPQPSRLCLRDQAEPLGATEPGIAEILQAEIAGGQFAPDGRTVPMQQNLPAVRVPQDDAGFKPFQPYV